MDKIKFFRSLGLTEYESKIIASLINSKEASARQMSEVSHVPQNKVYPIIKKFISLGVLAESPDKKYRLINVRAFVEERLSEREHELENMKNSFEEVELDNQSEEASFEIIKGQKAVMNKIVEINENVKKEILGVQRSWKVWGSGLRVMEKLMKDKVEVKMIGLINGETKGKAAEWKDIGCKIKAYNKKFGEFPLRFTIFDNKLARITLGKPEIPDPKDYITIITTSKPLITILRKQFLEMWKESKSF